MDHKILNIGILGCAEIARRSIIPAIKALPDKFNLVAISSRNLQKAKNWSLEFNCEAIEGYENILKREDIDAIYIPLPTGLHAEWVDKAIEQKKHVYCEKSFTHSYNHTKNLVSKAKKRSLILLEGFMFIYHAQQIKAKSIIDKGFIGEIHSFSGNFGFPPLAPDNFRYKKELGGGALLDAGAYPLRAARYFFDEKLSVADCSLLLDNNNVDLRGSAYLKTKNCKSAFISFGFDNGYKCSYEIWGSQGSIFTEKAYTPRSNMFTKLIFENKNGREIIDIEPDNHFVNILVEFYDSIINETPEIHYKDILEQSYMIEQIFEKDKINNR